MHYNWQLPDWPDFKYDSRVIDDDLYSFAGKIGHITAALGNLPEETRLDTIIEILAAEGVKTSEIEGEQILEKEVKSSIRNNLGLNAIPEKVKDERAAGVARLMVDARNSYAEPLTSVKLWEWHDMLLSFDKNIVKGQWRSHDEPMQVVSGAMGRQKVHFEAPPSARVAGEMELFIKWFNDTAPGGSNEIKKAPVRAALAHLYFESIHPFEDGNGRIGRAVAEKALSQTIGRPVLLSISRTIEKHKSEYYNTLESAQKDNEVTEWVSWFVKILVEAQTDAVAEIDFTVRKAAFFNRYREMLNERQLKIVRRMMEEGAPGFKGGMSASKYMGITKASKATATRDLQDLAEKGVFVPEGGGRSRRYGLNLGQGTSFF